MFIIDTGGGSMKKYTYKFILKKLFTPPARTFSISAIIIFLIWITYLCWSPGKTITDGRHDLKLNGIWIQHGWFANNMWFNENSLSSKTFRDLDRIQAFAATLKAHNITYIFPQLWPCQSSGQLPKIDHKQALRMFNALKDCKILPRVGGVADKTCKLDSANWRLNFVSSVKNLLEEYPQFAGIQLSFEPTPSGNLDFITLLREIRAAIPKDKLISVTASPPPTKWHPYPELHWDQNYFKSVARETDLLAVMLFNTSVRWAKLYQAILSQWTVESIDWAGDTKILLGLPTHDDTGIKFHDGNVENLKNSLRGIHAGLSYYEKLPGNYQGIALYGEWATDQNEWNYLKTHFCTAK